MQKRRILNTDIARPLKHLKRLIGSETCRFSLQAWSVFSLFFNLRTHEISKNLVAVGS